jgi:hypothetical protein
MAFYSSMLFGSSFNLCDVLIRFPCGTGSAAVADEPGGGWRGLRALHPGPVRPRRHQVRPQGPTGRHSGNSVVAEQKFDLGFESLYIPGTGLKKMFKKVRMPQIPVPGPVLNAFMTF